MNWQHYWKAILAFLVPGAVIIGSAVTSGSDGGTTITTAEWVTAIVAMIVTGGAVGFGPANAPATPATPTTGTHSAGDPQ
jgi:hypothetical protein